MPSYACELGCFCCGARGSVPRYLHDQGCCRNTICCPPAWEVQVNEWLRAERRYLADPATKAKAREAEKAKQMLARWCIAENLWKLDVEQWLKAEQRWWLDAEKWLKAERQWLANVEQWLQAEREWTEAEPELVLPEGLKPRAPKRVYRERPVTGSRISLAVPVRHQ